MANHIKKLRLLISLLVFAVLVPGVFGAIVDGGCAGIEIPLAHPFKDPCFVRGA